MELPGSTWGPKPDLNQRNQEMHILVGLQDQGRRIFARSCEEKLRQNRELIPSLQKALQEDSTFLNFVLKYNKLPIKDAFGELVSGTESLEVAVKKMEAKIHDQVKACDMLLHQLKLWSQARDERQRRLQDLQDAEADPKWKEVEMQTIRQLGNDIEKMLMKIQSGEIVTNLYLRLQEVLRRELVYQPRYLDLLSGMTVMYHEELTSKTTVLPNRVIKQAVSMLSAEQDQSSSETLMGADVEAAMARMQREAFVTDKMEKAKTALQCSCLWDIPSSIEAQRKSLENLQQHIDECNEKKNMLKKTLQNLESKQAQLKFNQPVSTASMQEEELREKLRQEEARLEQMRAHMLNNQKRLIEFENIIDNMFLRLQGISIPGKEDSGEVQGMEQKLQHCEQKMRFLKEQAAARPEDSPDEQSETFAKVRNLLEERTAGEKQNLRITFEDEGATEPDSLDFEEEEEDYVPSREDIKKQGQQLIRMNTRRRKKK
ncbi:coiled-coil domain-containing protein 183 [Melozone crissalis]|uniref:coiled-coil domain-containing protein 183 n=1 Tax=Melozone crissalis TaxID=40204 RepID=UPI0023D98E49|nr:coiled-coil domain-containing protein 183 [Melozone crissalis]